MRSISRVHLRAGLAVMCALGLSLALAGTRPQVDLSVNVRTTPEQLVPGGIVTVAMTVHNNGPDTAGGVLPNERDIIVYEQPYDIVSRRPPFLLFEPAVGCSAYAEESEYIPGLPGGGITLMFSYWFDAIPSGESRTCTYRLQVLPTTIESFNTYWVVRSSNDDDINSSNDRLDYTFVTASTAPPTSVPAGSPWAWTVLSIGFSLIAWRMLSPSFRRSGAARTSELRPRGLQCNALNHVSGIVPSTSTQRTGSTTNGDRVAYSE